MDNIYRFKLEGKTPLLCSNWQSMVGDKAPPKTDKENIKQALARAYRSEDGTLQFPVVGVRNSLVAGAKYEKINAGGTKVAATGLIKATVFVLNEFTDLLIDGKSSTLGEEATPENFDRRRAVNSGRNRGSIIRWRPVFRNWSLVVDFELEPSAWNEDNLSLLMTFFERAGNRVGVGDFRPACGGWFGRYTVELVGRVS